MSADLVSADEGSAMLATSILTSVRRLPSYRRFLRFLSSSHHSSDTKSMTLEGTGSRSFNGCISGCCSFDHDSCMYDDDCSLQQHRRDSSPSLSDCMDENPLNPMNHGKGHNNTLRRCNRPSCETDSLLVPKPALVKITELPHYLRFNQYILNGYRPPNMNFHQCISSLFYFHNETINIFTHIFSLFLFTCVMPYYLPWEEIQHPALAYTMVLGSFTSWVGSSIYHLFMNHTLGEDFYRHLLRWDVIGIWITQSIGASTTLYISSLSYEYNVRVTFMAMYALLSIKALKDCIQAQTALERVLGLTYLVAMRVVAFYMRIETLGFEQGNGSSLIHIVMQEIVPLIGSMISSSRIPERWFPGRFDLFFNSHNLMHILVIVGAGHMYYGAKADLLWLAANDV